MLSFFFLIKSNIFNSQIYWFFRISSVGGETRDDGASYEYLFLCVDSEGGLTNMGAPPGSECDFNSTDGYPNYGFTVDGADIAVSYCAGTCNQTCQDQCTANGDATQDSTVNVSDIILVVNHIIGSSTLSDSAFCSSDMNGDGTINVTDIIAIVNLIIGL